MKKAAKIRLQVSNKSWNFDRTQGILSANIKHKLVIDIWEHIYEQVYNQVSGPMGIRLRQQITRMESK